MPLDEKDVMLLRMLREDSKTPLRNMASAVGMSETAVKKRIENLKRKGAIRKFTVEINERAIGLARGIIFLNVNDVEKAAGFIKRHPFVSSVLLSSGDSNIIVEVEAPEGLIQGVFDSIKKARFVERAFCSTVVRRL